jgi:nucleoside-diphosphate-sugar epimerase
MAVRSWAPLLGLALMGFALARGRDEAGAEDGAAKVLVLGSGGLVGRTLVSWLEARNYSVLHVRNRRHIDLRVPGALDVFNRTKIDYAFFLACEVGGSKFIESSARDLQLGIIESNVRMYQGRLSHKYLL